LQRIRVLIADDHLVVRKGLVYLLKAQEEFELVGEANNGQEAVDLCRDHKPDVLLIDIKMPVLDGIEASRLILEENPEIKIVIMTSFEGDNDLVQDALEAGATSFLYKNAGSEELVNAIHLASKGQPYLSPDATRNLIQAKRSPKAEDFNLSEREYDVLRLMVDGSTNIQISAKLHISAATVKFHVSSILGKLHATSRTEAVSIALQAKLLDL
jgi:NarL family two-component system response regulator LiaR